MSEKLTAKQAAEQLLYKPEYAADKSADVKEKAAAFAEGYKAFLNAAKTEREAAAASEKLLLEAGYEKFEPKKTYAPGQKIYFVQEHKAVVAATIGRKSFEEGFRLVIAHIDSPRLDLRPNPLYEADHLSYFKTHYYGGIRKYQWGTMPLAIHGVFTRADGSSVSFAVGEDENDPVFCITDLLPHLGAEQNDRKLSEGIKAEELTAETFYQAVRSIGRYDGSCRLSVWLCQIAKHLWYQHLRKTRRQSETLTEDITLPVPSAEDDVLLRAEYLDLLRAVHTLPEPAREVLYLRLFGGLSFREISDVLGKTENWSRVTFYRAKERLKGAMEQDGEV